MEQSKIIDTLEMYQEHDEQENQARQHGPGHALSPDPPVSKTGIQYVGVRPGQALDTARAFRHDAPRRMEGAVQGRRGTSSPY